MKVAVIFTGALRTIKKTMKYFKKNVENVDVFACLQNDTNILDSEYELWIKSELGDHLKSITWFSIDDDFIKHRDKIINNMNISSSVSNYLKNSGSIIEYYQLQLAYMNMVSYERNNKYDYIIRLRTDTVFGKPIDFHWLHWTDSEVHLRVEKIKQELVESHIEVNDYNIVNYFMNTIISDSIIPNIYNIKANIIQRGVLPTISDLNNYIKNGSYILTLRKNLLYIVKRDLFYTVPFIGTMYGSHHGSNDHWWDSESQFQAVCYNSGLTIYDYYYNYDDNSLYNYNEYNYFDLNYDILNPYMLYCIVRY